LTGLYGVDCRQCRGCTCNSYQNPFQNFHPLHLLSREIKKTGDTLSEIAAANGLTLKQILAANPKLKEDEKYDDGNMIWAGTKINIPKKNSGGLIKGLSYMRLGGMAKGSDTVPTLLTPGEFVVRRSAVQDFGVKNLEKINSGEHASGSVYNYSLNVNVNSDANPDDIARAVITQIKQIDSQRVRGQRV
jgi:LysM repeat protein